MRWLKEYPITTEEIVACLERIGKTLENDVPGNMDPLLFREAIARVKAYRGPVGDYGQVVEEQFDEARFFDLVYEGELPPDAYHRLDPNGNYFASHARDLLIKMLTHDNAGYRYAAVNGLESAVYNGDQKAREALEAMRCTENSVSVIAAVDSILS